MDNLKFLFASILLNVSFCNSQSISSIPPNFTHFGEEKKLKEQQLFQPKGITPDGLLLLNDSLLLIRNSQNATAHFTIINIKQKKVLNTVLPVGRKSGQSLGFLSYGLYKNKLWVDDIMKENLIVLNINAASTKSQVDEYKIPFYYSTNIFNDTTVIGSGNYDIDYKISIVNFLSGQVVSQMIPWKANDGSLVPREQKMAYESFLYLKPSGEKCALACRYADKVEIINLNNKTSKIIKGPEGYEPDVMIATGNDGKKLSTRNKKTRYAFVKGKTTNDFIYLLYSGNNHLSKHSYYGNCLYVYNWEGEPVEKLKFTDDVVDFAVSNDNKTIYAYHPGNKFITVSNHVVDETK